MLQVATYSLKDSQGLLEYCADAQVRLVRGDFLRELHAAGRTWPRRQEAEQANTKDGRPALLSQDELEERLRSQWKLNSLGGRTHSFSVIALSHVWECREHPDPAGFQPGAPAVCSALCRFLPVRSVFAWAKTKIGSVLAQ